MVFRGKQQAGNLATDATGRVPPDSDNEDVAIVIFFVRWLDFCDSLAL